MTTHSTLNYGNLITHFQAQPPSRVRDELLYELKYFKLRTPGPDTADAMVIIAARIDKMLEETEDRDNPVLQDFLKLCQLKINADSPQVIYRRILYEVWMQPNKPAHKMHPFQAFCYGIVIGLLRENASYRNIRGDVSWSDIRNLILDHIDLLVTTVFLRGNPNFLLAEAAFASILRMLYRTAYD